MQKWLTLIALMLASTGSWAVTKCTEKGRTWYQDTPCSAGAINTQVETYTPQFNTNTPVLSQERLAPAAQKNELHQPLTMQPPQQVQNASQVLEAEAQMCFLWYKKLPSDMIGEVGSSYSSASKEGRVVTIKIPVKTTFLNQFNIATESTVEKSASCEIYNGRLDDGWTQIHAKRGGWIQ